MILVPEAELVEVQNVLTAHCISAEVVEKGSWVQVVAEFGNEERLLTEELDILNIPYKEVR